MVTNSTDIDKYIKQKESWYISINYLFIKVMIGKDGGGWILIDKHMQSIIMFF